MATHNAGRAERSSRLLQDFFKALAVFLSFAFTQVYVSAALPGPAPGGVPQQTLTARLTTRNNQPITVNGNAAGTGATILTGATIETPDQVGATLDLGDAGIVELEPNSKIQLDFDENGNVRVKVIRGCAATKEGRPGSLQVNNRQQPAIQLDVQPSRRPGPSARAAFARRP